MVDVFFILCPVKKRLFDSKRFIRTSLFLLLITGNIMTLSTLMLNRCVQGTVANFVEVH
jgi:hypothetical protein